MLQNLEQSGHGYNIVLVASGICVRCEQSLNAIKPAEGSKLDKLQRERDWGGRGSGLVAVQLSLMQTYTHALLTVVHNAPFSQWKLFGFFRSSCPRIDSHWLKGGDEPH